MPEFNSEIEAAAALTHPVETLTRGELYVVNNNMRVIDTEQQADGRNRARGAYQTTDFAGFKEFIEEADQIAAPATDVGAKTDRSPVFIDHNNVSAKAVLNYQQPGHAQGHCDHIATLKLEPTVTWLKLAEITSERSRFDQRSFATFLEDWADVLVAVAENGEEISARDAMYAVRNMKVDASVSTTSAVTNISESRSILEQVEAKSNLILPAYFDIKDTCYVGLDQRDIKLRLVVNSGEGKPTFALQIVKYELIKDQIIQNFKEKVIALLPGYPVRIGTFNAS